MDLVKNATSVATTWVQENPKSGLAVAAGLAACAAPVALVAGPALGAVGFGSSGVIGGSVAAGIQSSIGNVAAGSTFASLTSAGAGGTALGPVAAVVQVAGGAIAGIAMLKKAYEPGTDGGKPAEGEADADEE